MWLKGGLPKRLPCLYWIKLQLTIHWMSSAAGNLFYNPKHGHNPLTQDNHWTNSRKYYVLFRRQMDLHASWLILFSFVVWLNIKTVNLLWPTDIPSDCQGDFHGNQVCVSDRGGQLRADTRSWEPISLLLCDRATKFNRKKVPII